MTYLPPTGYGVLHDPEPYPQCTSCDWCEPDEQDTPRLDALMSEPSVFDEDGPGTCALTVVFTDGAEVTVSIMVPVKGEAVVMRDGILLAEDENMRCYSFPNVRYWYTE